MNIYEFTSDTRSFLENLPIPLAVYQYIDDRIRALLVSKAYLNVFGYASCEEAVYRLNTDIYRNVHPEDIARMEKASYSFATRGESYDVIFRNKNEFQSEYHIIHGTGRYMRANGARLAFITYTDETTDVDDVDNVKAVLTEMSGDFETSESVAFARHYDELTGLQNMTSFLKNSTPGLQKMWDSGRSPVVMYFDLANLKLYNSRYGFKAGDRQICRLAKLIGRYFGMEKASRFESDHFVAYAEKETAEAGLKALFCEMEQPGNGESLHVKVGIFQFISDETGLAEACDNARLASESLSSDAGSCFAYFDAAILERAHFKNYIFRNFDIALENKWIQVYYQPVVRTMTGTVCGEEALVRWIDPKYGMISPGQFIPILEETGQVYRLDLFVFEQVCRDYRDQTADGSEFVPVSINLSRKDFLHDDLAETLDDISSKYGVPRSFTDLEITESAFIDDMDKVGLFIKQFHELGYRVWMDDFGSGYSSLTVLNDYSFDQLKIDMSFLRSFDEKSKKIITSIVRMAKEIGVQTVAEGVETGEQYLFLKNAGCEKIQGYYFGRPMPLVMAIEHCHERDIELEEARWSDYLDAISGIDYLTDKPLCVVDDDGVDLNILFSNKAYDDILKRDNVESMEIWEKKINTPNDPVHTFHRQFADQQLRRLKGTQTIAYPSGDHYMQLTGHVVAKNDEHYLYIIHIQYIELKTDEIQQTKAEAINGLYYLCSDIALYDFEKNTVEGLKSSLSGQPMGLGTTVEDMVAVVDTWKNDYCYLPDQKRFGEFMDISSLRSRLVNNTDKMLTGFFRSRSENGEYRWLFHLIIPVDRTDFAKALHFTIETGLNEEKIREMASRLSNGWGEGSDDGITGDVLWKNQLLSAHQMYFWKDERRRYLGASNSFLRYFGLDSEKDIFGKTEEELNWHADPEPYKYEEEEILRTGKGKYLNIEKYIIDGISRDVVASKVPIFRDGRIIGIMGFVADVGETSAFFDKKKKSAFVDDVTGLANDRGLTDSLYVFLKEMRRNQAGVALIEVRVQEYDEVRRLYGDATGDQLLIQIGGALKKAAGDKAVTGRIRGSHFCIQMNFGCREEVKNTEKSIREEIGKIRRAGNWSGNCSAIISTACTTDVSTVSSGTFLTDIFAGIEKLGDIN